MNLTVVQKGLVLVALPLLFQLAFAGAVFEFQRELVEADGWATQTKEVIALTHEIHTAVNDARAGVQGFVITADPKFIEPGRRSARDLPRRLNDLLERIRDNPAQTAQARRVRTAAAAVIDWLGEVERLVGSGARDKAVARIRSGAGYDRMDAFRREYAAFLVEEERLDRERGATLERSRARLDAAVLGGGGAALAGTVVIGYAFRRGIARRFAALEQTARRLAAGADPPSPLDGADELAHLDRAFRDMAAALTRAADEVRDLYDNAPCGYHALAADGTFLTVNRTELDWLGYSAEELVGRRTFAELLTPESRERFRTHFPRFKQDGFVRDLEFDLVRRDGTTFPVLLNATAVCDADGRYVRSRSTVTDLTARKRAEAAVGRLNAELEDRVRERTAELEAANRDLAQKNAENEMFVYSVSHDLRSPLVNLQGFSKELEKGSQQLAALLAEAAVPADVRDRGRALLSGKMARSVGFIQTAVLRLSGIIDALLRLSRVGRVEYRREVVDLARVVGQVVGALQATIADRGAVVRVGDLPCAWGDRTAIEQVFGNLIGNALTYLEPSRRGEIDVGCLPGDEPSEFRTYFVRDNGLGVSDAHRQKIFQAFQRAHPGVGSGEGLGLAIVARVAERHRGRVWVESAPGAGSTFYVTLPAAPGTGRR
jgi:PAS domain S-box-containing protein